MDNRFISLEGLSGVGKSTVSVLLAERLGAKLMPTISPEFGAVRHILDASRSIHARFSFFVSAVLYTAEDVSRMLQSGHTVVVESYLYRAIAFHRGMGSTLSIQFPSEVVTPTDIFLLTCNEEERKARRRRQNKARTYWDDLAENNSARILKEYRRFPTTAINTSGKSPEKVVDVICDYLEKMGQQHEQSKYLEGNKDLLPAFSGRDKKSSSI